MSIIQCDEDCVYQQDGYCGLETPTVITNNTGKGCVYSIKVSANHAKNDSHSQNDFNQLPPQMRL
jgi:hydroxymethylpyrimidine/phosphomethylpyrimidine kinase